MSITRRNLLAGVAAASAFVPGLRADSHVRHYVRFRKDRETGFGELEGETIHVTEGSPLKSRKRNGDQVALSDAKLLYPIRPTKLFAVGLLQEPSGRQASTQESRDLLQANDIAPAPRSTDLDPARLQEHALRGGVRHCDPARRASASTRAKPQTTFWATPAVTTSPSATGKEETCSGGAPREPTRSLRWGRR